MIIVKEHEGLMKIIILNGLIRDSCGHGVHTMIMYTNFSHNDQFPANFQYIIIIMFVEIYI